MITKIKFKKDVDAWNQESYPHPGIFKITQPGMSFPDLHCVSKEDGDTIWNLPEHVLQSILNYIEESNKNTHKTVETKEEVKENFDISENTFLKTLAIVTGKVENIQL